jgi:non-specific serine/threonine protein kinase
MPNPNSTAETPLFCYRFGTAEFDEARLELRVGGLVVDLEHKPLQVLAELLRHSGEVLTRQELNDSVWASRPTVEEVLSNCIRKLRKALGDGGGQQIVTVPRVGYKLLGPVKRVAVGRRLLSRLTVKAGEPVPGCPQFILELQIAASQGIEVWRARHVQTKAIRVFKFSLDGERLASLKREATLYRVLRESLGDRDDIVRILAWNFETPPFFLECEYGGENLDVWASTSRRLESLALFDRLELFLQIADAVAAAHAVGVLHKDLKPTNVLVTQRPDGAWQMRVADFGSGSLMDPECLEALGITRLDPNDPVVTQSSPFGTALYVAPEVLAGELPSAQTDVFALGLLLYQITIGDLRKPLVSGWERDIVDELLIEDVAAATDGNRARRMASVAELVHRLRSLESRRAHRASARQAQERLVAAEKVAERNRAQRPWLIAASVSLALGLLVSLCLYKKQLDAQRESQRERLRAEQINRFLTQDLLGVVDPSGPGGMHDVTIKETLVRAASRLGNRFNDDPVTRGSIEVALGRVYSGLTDYAAADVQLRNAIEHFKAVRGEADDATLDAEYRRAFALMSLNRLADTAALLDNADRHAGTRLAESSQLAFQAHMAHANLYSFQYKPADALKEFLLADRVRAAIAPDDILMLYRVTDGISWCYARLDRLDDAERVLRPLLAERYTVESVGPTSWSELRLEYGAILKAQGRYDEAVTITRVALKELESSLGADAFFVGLAWNYLGDIYNAAGDFASATEPTKKTYEIMRARLGEHAQNTLSAAADLGILDYHEGHYEEAVQKLSTLRNELLQKKDLADPLLQYTTFYLASAQIEGRLGEPTEIDSLIAHLDPAALAAVESSKGWDQRLEALSAEVRLREAPWPENLRRLSAAVAKMTQDGISPAIVGHYQEALAEWSMAIATAPKPAIN